MITKRINPDGSITIGIIEEDEVKEIKAEVKAEKPKTAPKTAPKKSASKTK